MEVDYKQTKEIYLKSTFLDNVRHNRLRFLQNKLDLNLDIFLENKNNMEFFPVLDIHYSSLKYLQLKDTIEKIFTKEKKNFFSHVVSILVKIGRYFKGKIRNNSPRASCWNQHVVFSD